MYKIISPLSFFSNSTVNSNRVADQIATLLNQNNNLKTVHNRYTITNDNGLYLVYLYNGDVVGCTEIRVEHPTLTRNLHTSVNPLFRKQGLGKYLVQQAINNCTTNNMFVTIREDNISSLKL